MSIDKYFRKDVLAQVKAEWKKVDEEKSKSKWAVIHDFSSDWGYVVKGEVFIKRIKTKNNHNWGLELIELNIHEYIKQYKINDFDNKVWWLEEIDWQPPGQQIPLF